eukprot:gb/GECG01010154.1/.p1 GENE.gb/GECG01010154.1/~~gb/GECG01010154.1/.p1  ORF type:complete len:110 (+),score=3.40 gb/GECG01010154.1/:1-330(+)
MVFFRSIHGAIGGKQHLGLWSEKCERTGWVDSAILSLAAWIREARVYHSPPGIKQSLLVLGPSASISRGSSQGRELAKRFRTGMTHSFLNPPAEMLRAGEQLSETPCSP